MTPCIDRHPYVLFVWNVKLIQIFFYFERLYTTLLFYENINTTLAHVSISSLITIVLFVITDRFASLFLSDFIKLHMHFNIRQQRDIENVKIIFVMSSLVDSNMISAQYFTENYLRLLSQPRADS